MNPNSEFIFPAAICRDKAEGGDGTRYFGSTAAYTSHEIEAVQKGWLDDEKNLTPLGRMIGDACKNIPDGRAYVYGGDYIARTEDALAEYAGGRTPAPDKDGLGAAYVDAFKEAFPLKSPPRVIYKNGWFTFQKTDLDYVSDKCRATGMPERIQAMVDKLGLPKTVPARPKAPSM